MSYNILRPSIRQYKSNKQITFYKKGICTIKDKQNFLIAPFLIVAVIVVVASLRFIDLILHIHTRMFYNCTIQTAPLKITIVTSKDTNLPPNSAYPFIFLFFIVSEHQKSVVVGADFQSVFSPRLSFRWLHIKPKADTLFFSNTKTEIYKAYFDWYTIN